MSSCRQETMVVGPSAVCVNTGRRRENAGASGVGVQAAVVVAVPRAVPVAHAAPTVPHSARHVPISTAVSDPSAVLTLVKTECGTRNVVARHVCIEAETEFVLPRAVRVHVTAGEVEGCTCRIRIDTFAACPGAV